MDDQGLWSLQRAPGVLLILGFAAMLVGALMFLSRGGAQEATIPRSPRLVWERSFIMAAVVFTAVGLILLEDYLHNTGGGILARMGASTYLFAGVLLVTAEAFSLSRGEENVYALIVIYVVLAFLAQAAVGGALLQSNLLPAWIGWMTIAWNLGWLVVLPITIPGDIYFPVLHHLMPLLIGILLLLRDAGLAVA